MKNKYIDTLLNYFKTKAEVAAVYLFGSHARGEANAQSDIDLAILFKTKKKDNFDKTLIYNDELEHSLSQKIEVQDIEVVSLTFAYRIISEGKIIFQAKEQKRVYFETKLLRQYLDLKDFFDEYNTTIVRLAREGKINARPFTY